MQPTQPPPSNCGLLVFLGIVLVYAYPALCVYRIACKAGAENPWYAWVPIANLYLLCEMGGMSGWWVLACFVPYVGGLVVLGLSLSLPQALCVDGAQKYLICLPGVNLIYMGYLAFRKEPAYKSNSLV